MARRKEMFKGARVVFEGRLGTVTNDSDAGWVTAPVEFDDEPCVIIQKDKNDLEYAAEEYEQVENNRMMRVVFERAERRDEIERKIEVGLIAQALVDEGTYPNAMAAAQTAESLWRAGIRKVQ